MAEGKVYSPHHGSRWLSYNNSDLHDRHLLRRENPEEIIETAFSPRSKKKKKDTETERAPLLEVAQEGLLDTDYSDFSSYGDAVDAKMNLVKRADEIKTWLRQMEDYLSKNSRTFPKKDTLALLVKSAKSDLIKIGKAVFDCDLWMNMQPRRTRHEYVESQKVHRKRS